MFKKIILCMLCLTMLFTTLTSCSKKADVNEYNLPVTEEKFESMTVLTSQGSYKKYQSEQEMYDDCDLVVIGMPINTYTDEKVVYCSKDDRILTEVESRQDYLFAITIRNIKVLEVLKGDPEISEVEIGQCGHVYTPSGSDEQYISDITPNEFVAKQNVKYIYYLKLSNNAETGKYYACPDQGVVNIDTLDDNAIKHISSQRLVETMNKYKQQFDKYNRYNETKEE